MSLFSLQSGFAQQTGEAMSWVIGGVLIVLIMRFFWQSYIHPANARARQAAGMNWVAVGRRDNPKGGKEVLLGRGRLVSRIDWRTEEVHLIEPYEAGPFADYLTLERWLTLKEKEAHDVLDAHARRKYAFYPMARAQEDTPPEAGTRTEDDTEVDPGIEELYQFTVSVQARLREGPGGEELHDIDETFRLNSPEYLHITTELFRTAIDLGKSPTEAATCLVMAFAAANEENALEPVTRVIVYLRGVITYWHNHA